MTQLPQIFTLSTKHNNFIKLYFIQLESVQYRNISRTFVQYKITNNFL